MTKRYDILSRDMARAMRKIVRAMELCNIDPSGVINIEVTIPILDPETENVSKKSTFKCDMAEMEKVNAFFDEQSIKFIQTIYDKNGDKIVNVKGRTFGKKVVNNLLDRKETE